MAGTRGVSRKPKAKSDQADNDMITHSISFDWPLFETMERERLAPREPINRSQFVRQALEEKFKRAGVKIERTKR